MTPPRDTASGMDGGEVDLALVLKILARRWLFIIATLCVFVGLAVAYLQFATPVYRATTRVLVDPRDKQVVGQNLAQPMQGIDIVWIETQADLVKSTATLSTVIKSERLDKDPEFAGGGPDETLANLANAILVERAEDTYVLDIHVMSMSAEKAARLSGAVADAYVLSLTEAKAEAAGQANVLLSRQVDALRAKAREADEKLQEYRRQNGLVTANGRQVDEETLRQLNDEYLQARLASSAARERRDALRQALKSDGAPVDQIGGDSASAVLSRLRIEYALASKKLADLSQQLGPNHPRMISANADLNRTRALILEQVQALSRTADGDYELALARERNTKAALDAATNDVNNTSLASVQLRELENEANARRQIYQAFVSRIEETGTQESVQVSDARVVAKAQVPQRPFSPRRMVVLGIAGIAGLGIGLSGALFRGRNDLRDAFASRRQVPLEGRSEPAFDPAEDVLPPTVSDKPDRVAETSPLPAADPIIAEQQVAAPMAPMPAPRQAANQAFAAAVAPDEDTAPPATATATRPRRLTRLNRPERERAAPPVTIIGELLADTRRSIPGHTGRPIARSLAAVAASAIELEDGAVDEAVVDRFADMIEAIAEGIAPGGILLVAAETDPGTGIAGAYALARLFAEIAGPTVLLDLDASGEPGLSAAFAEGPAAGLLDVVSGDVTLDDLAMLPIADDVDLVPLHGIGGAELMPRRRRVAELAEDIAREATITIAYAGPAGAGLWGEAFRGIAAASLIIADRWQLGDGTAPAEMEAARRALPGLLGFVAVDADAAARAAA